MNLFENTQKHTQELEALIANADRAITEENFSYLMNFYSENGSLVVKDGLHVHGKENLKKAFSALAEFFNHSL